MPKRKIPELKPDEQFKRFIDAAREHGVDPEGREVERQLKKLSRKPKPQREVKAR